MAVEPGSVVVAPLGPRQLIGVAWEADRLKTEEVGDNRLRPLAGLVDVPPIPAGLRRLCEWTADYYLAPLAAVLRMVMPSSAALAGPRTMVEYRATGEQPSRLTPQREQALSRIEGRQGTVRELAAHAEVSEAVMRGLVHAGALERVEVDGDQPFAEPDPDFAPPILNAKQQDAAASLKGAVGNGFDLRPSPILNSMSFGVHALCLFDVPCSGPRGPSVADIVAKLFFGSLSTNFPDRWCGDQTIM